MFDTPYNIDERPKNWHIGPVQTAQIEWELYALIVELRKIKPSRHILEIGTMYGGTLYHLLDNAHPGAKVVTIDWGPEQWIPPKTFDNSIWWKWCKPMQTLEYIKADSSAADTIEQVRDHFPNGLDILFIDGNHRYDGVLADWLNYGPMVRAGGIVIFHDLVTPDNPKQQHIQVGKLWREIQAAGYVTKELQAGAGKCGIGVVYV